MKKILLGLTTTSGSDWRGKIEEIKKFNIGEIALFLTYIKKNERKVLYDLLEKTNIKSIPHIHLRDDHELSEIDYLVEKYHVKAMNLHYDEKGIETFERLEKYQEMIYFENQWLNRTKLEVIEHYFGRSGGMCVDFSHLEDVSVTDKNKKYIVIEWIKKYPIGCSHISAVRNVFFRPHSFHKYKKLTDFDYMLKYISYLPELISLELENSFEEQIKAKNYLEKKLVGTQVN